MHIGFCYNIKKNLPSTDPKAQIDAEFDAPETIAAIKSALESTQHQVTEIEANEEAFFKLHARKKELDIVFNIAEGYYGSIREAQIPAICDLLQIPYTHSSALTHAIGLDKSLTKMVLNYHSISTPKFQMLKAKDESLRPDLSFPLILKPNAEGSSKGVMNENLVYDINHLRQRVTWLFENFHESVLVEEFLDGREFTVAILGNDPPQVLPIVEQRYDLLPKKYAKFASYEVKWLWEDTLQDLHDAYACPASLDESLKQKIEKICLDTFSALNCFDVARIDVRLDKNGEPNVLEINTLPGMIPGKVISYLPIAARAKGLTYNQMVLSILDAALKRYKIE